MANANTSGGFYLLTSLSTTGTSATPYLVPAAAGTYPGLPSPSQVASNVLVLGVQSGDAASGAVDNGNSFAIRVNGICNVAQSESVTLTIYQATAAAVATGFTSVSGTGQTSFAASSASTITTKNNFSFEVICNYDSTSKVLNGYKQGLVGGTITSPTAVTAITGLAEKDLNFYFAVTMGSTGTGDSISNVNFTWERF
jgi:hypothetical protein